MVIQHNMEAANTNRKLGENVKANRIWSEKLASGYRVNRAADDAAGLAISEEMRAQIRGLNRGSVNCTEGISLLQSADGALVEVHSILDRIKELSVQSANDVNTTEDRRAIQNEVVSLLDEIDRIGNDTEYNTIKIFTGGESSMLGPDGNPITMDQVPFQDIHLSDISLGNRPFSGNSPSELNLVASLDSNYTTANGAPVSWPLIFGSGSTSYPNFRVSYASDSGNNVTEEKELTAMPVGGYVYNAADQSCTRVYHYESPAEPDVKFDITQKITVNDSSTDPNYKYYQISYTVENKGNKDGTVDFMFHTDTSYGGGTVGDHKEGYYVGGSRVPNACLYSNQYPGLTNPNIDPTIPAEFSIANIDTSDMLPFSEKIRFTGSRPPNTIAIGTFSMIHDWDHYDNIATGRNDLGLGYSTGSGNQSIDLGFSLIWGGESITAGNRQEFSFQYGINDVLRDSSLPQGVAVRRSGNVHTDILNLWIQSGANSFDGMYVTIGAMNASTLNIRSLDVTTQDGAGNANELTDKAIEKISLQRAGIGAFHNRLEYAQSVDDLTSENLQAAESIIRDMDIADGMVNYAKTNILMQAGQAMLAQSNQATQGVLSLLR